MAIDYRGELEAIAQGIDVNRYYDAWRLMLILWRSVWYHSATDWSKYRLRIWGMFTERIESAARTAGDLDGFLSRAARFLNLTAIGGNEDDRREITRLLALPARERRALMRQLREDTAVLVALVRRWRDENKQAFEDEEVE